MVDAILGKLRFFRYRSFCVHFSRLYSTLRNRSLTYLILLIFYYMSAVMDTVTKEWDILTMVDQAWVVVPVLQEGRFTSTQSSRTVLEFQRSQDQQQQRQQQLHQQRRCQQDWIVHLAKINDRVPGSFTKILEMVNRRAEETSLRGLDPKTDSITTVSTETNSTITYVSCCRLYLFSLLNLEIVG